MPEEWMALGNQIGYDMFELLHRRLQETFANEPATPSARLGPTVILVASVLRDPVARGVEVDNVVGFASQRLRKLLDLFVAEGGS